MTEESPKRPDRRDARHDLLTVIEDIADADKGAPIGVVVDRVVRNDHSPTATFEAFAGLVRTGAVYEPSPGLIRRTTRNPIPDTDE